jgi:6,7-dimethyl-8-ribityllumazine synthase
MSSAQQNLSSFDPDNLPNLPNAVIGIVVAEWHSEITNALLNGALEALELAKVKPQNIHVFKVPGTYELPYGAVKTIDKHQPDAVVCLGCVIQGETRHFDFICNAVANGLMQLNIQYKIPVTFGVLTTDNLEQAQNRSGGKHGNKGFEAGLTALKSIQ